MPLTFHPNAGTILICDFATGFQPPEMVKVRPVVVVSPRRRVSPLVTVVPLSSTPPVPPEPWHHCLAANAYPAARGPIWAKCDVVVTVALARLDRVRAGGGGYKVFQMPPADMATIRACIRAALAL